MGSVRIAPHIALCILGQEVAYWSLLMCPPPFWRTRSNDHRLSWLLYDIHYQNNLARLLSGLDINAYPGEVESVFGYVECLIHLSDRKWKINGMSNKMLSENTLQSLWYCWSRTFPSSLATKVLSSLKLKLRPVVKVKKGNVITLCQMSWLSLFLP